MASNWPGCSSKGICDIVPAVSTGAALAQLQQDPKTFLKTTVLVIAGSTGSPAGVATFKFEKNGKGGYKATYLHPTQVNQNKHEFEAFYVPMIDSAELESGFFTAVRLPAEATSPSLMLTCQITACMFAVARSGKQTWVAHIQPDQTKHGDDAKYKDTDQRKHAIRVSKLRQKDLRTLAKNQDLKPFVAKGKTYSDMERVAVVGYRDNIGNWKIIAQRMSENFQLSTEFVTGITKF